jgi:hypothetical protein
VSTEAGDIIVICYQAMTGEDTADKEDLLHAVVNCRVHELVIMLYEELLVVTICKGSINPLTNQNPIYI